MIHLTDKEAALVDFLAMNIPADLLNQEQWETLSMLDARIIGATL